MTKSTKRSAESPDGGAAPGGTGKPLPKPPRGVTVRVVYAPDREAQIEALIAVFESGRHRAEAESGGRVDGDGEAGR